MSPILPGAEHDALEGVPALRHRGEAPLAEAAQRAQQRVAGAGVKVEFPAAGGVLHRDVNAAACAFVSGVGQDGQVLQVGPQDREDELTGGGDVVDPAGQDAGDPQRDAAGGEQGADLSPEAPAMDIYLYPFGSPGHQTVLKDVSYGNVSAYMAVSPGPVHRGDSGLRRAGVEHSRPGLKLQGGWADGVHRGGVGPDPGLQVEVLTDELSLAPGKALVRVVQALLKQHRVTVSDGLSILARQLAFGVATSYIAVPYIAVPPGVQTVHFTASGEHAGMPVQFAADTVHTIVILDAPSGLKVDALIDAAGSQIMPAGGASTGLGGMASRPATAPTAWLLTMAAGALLTALGIAGLRRSRPCLTAGRN